MPSKLPLIMGENKVLLNGEIRYFLIGKFNIEIEVKFL